MLRSRALYLAACLAVPLSTAAAQQSCDTSRTQIPTLLTVEGGGSLGVYEAGMTFTLVETFKRKWLGESNPTLARLAPLCLSIATGASAGSINAFMAAANWCDARLTNRPEESVFWRTWVTTGVMQLLPQPGEEDSTNDQSVFSRRHFNSYIDPALRGSWRGAKWVDNCHVEFGATATRLYADTLQGVGWLAARNQRMAFALTVTGIDTAQGAPVVRQFLPDTRLQRGSFGSLNTLPNGGRTIAWPNVFRLLNASSAFPVAFEPVQLDYCTYEDVAEAGATDKCDKSALVLDGGVFDNAPLSLTYLLSLSQQFSARPTTLLFLTPDRQRTWDDEVSRDVVREPTARKGGIPPFGLEEMAQLVGEMIPTAREYELQIAGRVVPMEMYLRLNDTARQQIVLQGAPATGSGQLSPVAPVADMINRNFRATARWHPLAGDWLGGFGGFLGRPLREYDFYVGMYDALVLLAENLLCEEGRTQVYAAQMQAAKVPYKQCVSDAVAALIARPPFPLGDVATRTLITLHHDEFVRGRSGAPLPRNVAATRMTSADSSFVVVDAVREALRRVRVIDTAKVKDVKWYHPQAIVMARHCANSGLANAIFCDSKIVAFFDRLDEDRLARRVLMRWTREGQCTTRRPITTLVTNAWKEPDRCRAERSFVSSMKDPEGNLYELSRQVLGRLEERTPSGGGMGTASGAILYVHATVGDRHRRSWDIGRSTIPLDESKKLLFYALPSSWGLTPNIRGLGEIGWELRRHLWAWPLALSFPMRVRPLSQIGTDGMKDHTLLIGGARLEHKALFLSTRAGFQADVWCRPSDGIEKCNKGYTPGVYVSVLGKLNATWTKVPPRLTEYRKQNSTILTIGVGDLNGLIYWILRK